jgi:hypothetical protein
MLHDLEAEDNQLVKESTKESEYKLLVLLNMCITRKYDLRCRTHPMPQLV